MKFVFSGFVFFLVWYSFWQWLGVLGVFIGPLVGFFSAMLIYSLMNAIE